MKKVAAFLLFGLMTLDAHAQAVQSGGNEGKQSAARPAFKAHVLSRTELDALLAAPARLLIVDVRRPDELTSIGGFPAYLSIQLADLERHLAFIPKDRTIVTVSNHASRAGRAADLLAAKGFTVAGAVGAQDYEAQGGTLAKIVAPPPKTAASKN